MGTDTRVSGLRCQKPHIICLFSLPIVVIPVNMFGDLKSAAGVKALDEFLAEHSYIEGFVPSQADTAVYKALSGAPKSETASKDDDDDDDVDLFGSDEESDDEEKKRITEERLKAYHEKKSKKPKVIAKTSVLFDVKPWDDETDMDAMLKEVKSIEMEGLVWGASKLVPVGY